jgi:hypothetical protein
VNVLADDPGQSRLVICDLRAGQFGELGPEPSSSRAGA